MPTGPPPCRFVPWAMHTEGQRTRLTWRIDALYNEPKVRSTCDIFRGLEDHPAHVPGRVEAAATPSFVPRKGQRLPNTGQLPRLWCRSTPRDPLRSPEASATHAKAPGAPWAYSRLLGPAATTTNLPGVSHGGRAFSNLTASNQRRGAIKYLCRVY